MKDTRLRSPLQTASTADAPGLVSDEVAEVVGENAEQRQTRNSIRGEDPEVASFARMDFRGGR